MKISFHFFLLCVLAVAAAFTGCSGCCCKPKDGEIINSITLNYRAGNVPKSYQANFQEGSNSYTINYDEFPAGIPFQAYLSAKSSACIMSVKTSWRKEHDDRMVFYQPWQEKQFLNKCMVSSYGQRITGLAGAVGDVYGFFVSGADTKGRSINNSNLFVRFKYIPGISPANTPTPGTSTSCLSQGQLLVSLAWNQLQSGAKWAGSIAQNQINSYCAGRRIKKIIIPYKVSCFAQPSIIMTDWRVKVGSTEYTGFTCNEASNQCVKDVNIPLSAYTVEAHSPNWHSEDPNSHPSVLNFQPVMINFKVE
ncbi:MAG: hypothetical protein CVV21_11285 [Candidatus Goldiibacteriota bacterium HGW-Goldbacteria-1]|jgi:hypothetical protein|nr:MAG: hypothetical protein CVV21_11285 [Candidatus Goldiibacteriota bacterium HGW-Goldbacteria-1]